MAIAQFLIAIASHCRVAQTYEKLTCNLSSDTIFAPIFCPFSTQLQFTFLTPPFSPLCLSPYAFHTHEQTTRTQFDWYYRTPNNSSTGLPTSRNSPVVVPPPLDPTQEHWGQGPIYPVGTWWVHCGDRQHLTTMYPVIKNWVHFECSLQWVHNVYDG